MGTILCSRRLWFSVKMKTKYCLKYHLMCLSHRVVSSQFRHMFKRLCRHTTRYNCTSMSVIVFHYFPFWWLNCVIIWNACRCTMVAHGCIAKDAQFTGHNFRIHNGLLTQNTQKWTHIWNVKHCPPTKYIMWETHFVSRFAISFEHHFSHKAQNYQYIWQSAERDSLKNTQKQRMIGNVPLGLFDIIMLPLLLLQLLLLFVNGHCQSCSFVVFNKLTCVRTFGMFERLAHD